MRLLEKNETLNELASLYCPHPLPFYFCVSKNKKGRRVIQPEGCRVATGGGYSKYCKLTLSLLIWYPPLALVCKHTSGFLPPNFFP